MKFRKNLPPSLITAAIITLYILMASQTTLWDRDEPRFARATVEMVESGNYLYPTFNGHVRYHKPILIYWLMSLPVRILGATELACRFFSAMGLGVTCWLTYFIGERMLGRKTGMWAMLILATSGLAWPMGSIATTDAVLLAFMVAVVAVFVCSIVSGLRFYHFVFMGLTLGGALLAKGPVGYLPVVAMAVVLWLNRKSNIRTSPHLWLLLVSTMVGTILFLLWAIPANHATKGELLESGMGAQFLGRILKPMENHGGNLLLYAPYYFIVVLLGFLPWTLYLLGAVSLFTAPGRPGKIANLLIGWFTTVFIIMTFVATKLPNYILFVWPVMSIAVAETIVRAEMKQLSEKNLRWLRRGVWLFGPLIGMISLALFIVPWLLPISDLKAVSMLAGSILLVSGIWTVRNQLNHKPHTAAKVLLAGTVFFMLTLFIGILPIVDRLKVSPAIARVIKDKTQPYVPVAAYGYFEPSLHFYVARPINEIRGGTEVLWAWTNKPGPRAIVLPRQNIEALMGHVHNSAQEDGRLLQILGSKKGFNFANGDELDIVALFKP